MSLIPRTMSFSNQLLPIHNPGYLESYVCSPSFGQNILPLDCELAVNLNWPRGATPVHYYFREPAASNSIHLPVHDHHGSCTVSLESAGPPLAEYERTYSEPHPYLNYFTISPERLRGLAGYIIQKCAREQNGLGGYVTMRFSAAEKWLQSLALSKNELRQDNNGTSGRPNDGAFLTLSISNPTGFAFNPGDTDPSIAARLALHAANLSVCAPDQEMPARKAYFLELAKEMRLKMERMTRGRSDGEKWWEDLDGEDSSDGWGSDFSDGSDMSEGSDFQGAEGSESIGSSPEEAPGGGRNQEGKDGKGERNGNNRDKHGSNKKEEEADNMFYDCDSTLGAPTALDCEKLSWSGLQPPSAIETLTPGKPKIFTQGTCALGISSAIATTITWAQLLAAFETLNNLCVQNPLKEVKGGRAYFGKQGIAGWIGEKRKRSSRRRKRDRIAGVSGADALPMGVNATVWKHDEDVGANVNCEWGKAAGRQDVRGC